MNYLFGRIFLEYSYITSFFLIFLLHPQTKADASADVLMPSTSMGARQSSQWIDEDFFSEKKEPETEEKPPTETKKFLARMPSMTPSEVFEFHLFITFLLIISILGPKSSEKPKDSS